MFVLSFYDTPRILDILRKVKRGLSYCTSRDYYFYRSKLTAGKLIIAKAPIRFPLTFVSTAAHRVK